MIVVGAGIIGLSCAWRLAQRGVRVTVFEAREAGAEASWAGAGMLAPGGEIDGDSALARMCVRSLALYPEFVLELREVSGLEIEFQRCGALELAFTEADAQDLEWKSAGQVEIGIRSERVPQGRFYPDDAVVNPRQATAALKLACERSGVAIREQAPVADFGDRDEGILIAAGAWSPGAFPVRGHLIAYGPEAPKLGHILRRGHTYLLPRGDRLIAGSSTERAGYNRSIDPEVVSDIRRRAEELLPGLREFAPAECWNGFRPAIEGGTPAIGRLPGTRIWHAFGHYRNGILLAPETARMIAADF